MLQEAFKPFLETLPRRKFQQDNILVYQGEVPRDSYIVKCGIIKVYNITQQGDERIVTFKTPGDLFPTSWSLGQVPSAYYYYEAISDGELYVTSNEALDAYVADHPAATAVLAGQYLSKYAGSLMRITALEQPKASDKVLYTLYYLLKCYGEEKEPGKFRIKMQLTQQMVADMIGLTRETTAAELVKLKNRQVLTYRGGEYVIDREKLIKTIGEDNFKDLQQ